MNFRPDNLHKVVIAIETADGNGTLWRISYSANRPALMSNRSSR